MTNDNDPTRIVTSRQRTPDPPVIQLGGYRPGLRTVSLATAGVDYPLSRPLGYAVRSLTLIAPGGLNAAGGNLFATGINTDSVYIDTEETNVQAGTTPNALGGTAELPPGTMLTLEEVDPGWYHVASPTAAQRLFCFWGGPRKLA
jgi:hypothetical protein